MCLPGDCRQVWPRFAVHIGAISEINQHKLVGRIVASGIPGGVQKCIQFPPLGQCDSIGSSKACALYPTNESGLLNVLAGRWRKIISIFWIVDPDARDWRMNLFFAMVHQSRICPGSSHARLADLQGRAGATGFVFSLPLVVAVLRMWLSSSAREKKTARPFR
jgi:hypothetical protein